MAIVRLALGNPSADTDTLLHTAVRQSLVSIISTNKSTVPATIRVWIQPSGSSSVSEYAFLAYDTILPANNSLETFRVALEMGDKVYVRSSTSDVSFSLNGIHDSSGNYNKVFIQDTQPTATVIGDVWVSEALGYVKFWDGTYWINAVPGSAGYAQNTQPPYPQEGQLWVDLDDVSPFDPTYPTVSYGTTQPTGLTILDAGAIWINANSGTANVWNGSGWSDFNATLSYQSSAPSTAEPGMMWLDSDDNKLYVYNGSSWVLTTAPGSAYQSSTPSAPSTGQLWVDSVSKKIYVYNGSSWVPAGNGPTGGGTNAVFVETDQIVSTDYSITTGKNAMSTGSVTINSGITVTIPAGSVWVIV